MATASFLITDVQTKLGDPSGNIFTSATLFNWLNEAQKEFCERLTPLRQIDATSVGTGLNRFQVPSDRIMVEGLFSRKQIGRKLKALTWTDFNNQMGACPGARGYDSDSWSESDDSFYVHPAYGVGPAMAILASPVQVGDTTISVNSTATFKDWGRIRIDSEEIEYSSKDTTTFYGCSRGLAGTADAFHTSKGTIAYQLDLWIVYRRAPAQMTAVTESPEIKPVYHEMLELYVMYLAFLQAGEKDKAESVWKKWDEFVKRAEYQEARETLTPIGIHDMETQSVGHLMGPR